MDHDEIRKLQVKKICTAGADYFNVPERALGIDRRLSCTRGSSAALTSRRGT